MNAVRAELPPAHSSKPDRDEPWRYVCPDCGSQVDGSHARQGEYRCCSCRSQHPPENLLDQKTGETGVRR